MKKILLYVLCISCMVLSLSSCGKDKSKTSSAENETAPINVTTKAAANQTIASSVTYSGEIKPADEVSVSAKVSGKVRAVNVDIGTYVNAGDILFEIDDTDYRLQYNQALASYNSAVSNYESTVGGTQKQSVTQAEQSLTSAQLAYDSALSNYNREKQLYENNSNVITAKTAYDNAVANYNRTLELYNNDTNLINARNALSDAETNLKRMQSLFEIGGASQLELDNANTAVKNAQANLQTVEASVKSQLDSAKAAVVNAEEALKTATVNAKAALDNAQTSLKNAEESLKAAKENRDLTVNVLNPEREVAAKAQVSSAKAALDIAANTLSNAKVTAPISGYVTACDAVKGQNVQQGSSPVKIVNMNSVEVEINVTEAIVSSLSQGMHATVSVKSASLEGIDGTIVAVSPSKNSTTGLFTVKISVPNESGALKGGMFAEVSIITTELKDVLSVPTDSVITDGQNSYVYVNNNGTAEKRAIVTGMSDKNYTQVLSGVSIGENVVLTGKEFITEENNRLSVTQTE
ncbi:MAG: efflux RND transporter periplasmic adaptor subunit [Clostridia bacterium]|nr:efflux RND transporter periplasmic adaptor subunit [Clostridia bacterium]